MKNSLRHIANVTLTAFLLNAFLPFFAVYDTPKLPPAKEMSSLFGDKVLICTGDGFQWVTWEELQKQGSRHESSRYKCGLCYLAAHGLKDLLTPASVTLARVEENGKAVAIRGDHSAALTLALAFASRAPPSSFLS